MAVDAVAIHGPGRGGSLKVGELIVTVAPQQTVDFAFAGDQFSFFELIADLHNDNAGTATYSLRLNGAGTNISYTRMLAVGTGNPTADLTAGPWGALTGAPGWGRLFMACRSGFKRVGEARGAIPNAAGAFVATSNYLIVSGVKFDATTVITQVGVGADVASGLGVGTRVQLYGWP